MILFHPISHFLFKPWPVSVTFVLLSLLSLIVALLLTLVLIRAVWRLRYRRCAVKHIIHVRNAGNVDSAIQLSAITADRQLMFRYFLGETRLPTAVTQNALAVPEPAPLKLVTALPPQPVSSAPAQAVARPPSASVQAPAAEEIPSGQEKEKAGGGASKVGGAVRGVESKAEGASNFAFILSGIAGTLSNLIPASGLSRWLDRTSSSLRSSATRANSLFFNPRMRLAQARDLKDNAGELKTMTAKKPRGIVAQPPDIETPPESTTSRVSGQASVTSPAIGAPVSVEVSVESETASASTKNVRSARAFRGVGQAVTIQLPLMRPEAEVEIELRMDARNPYRSGSYHYWLVSHYEDEEEQPFILDPSQPARLVSIQRLPGWLLGLTVFLTFAVLLINTFWLAYLVQWFLIRFS